MSNQHPGNMFTHIWAKTSEEHSAALHRKVGFFDFAVDRGGEKFLVDLSSHESSAGESATHEEKPDGTPSKCFLQGTDGEEAN